ncbi:MAG: HAMP domain-containing histidine kinase [Balneolales bacterium]|nr:HAMP domain-containing histidine kinase [Balneolales bacterium]
MNLSAPSTNSFRIKAFIIGFLLVLAISSFVYTQYLIVQIRDNERASTELWAKASGYISVEQYPQTQEMLKRIGQEIQNHPLIGIDFKTRWKDVIQRAQSDLSNAGLDFVASEVIINNLFEIPSVVVNEDNQIVHYRNIRESDLSKDLIDKYRALNEPITFTVGDGESMEIQKLYYGNSAIVSTLTYFPYIQFGLLALFLGLGYASLSSIKRNEQSKLWVGMARESAHQLGTPISSLMGWVALLKEMVPDNEQALSVIHELENDVGRLQSIADRFNKIGSEPELKVMRIGPVISNVATYMNRRLPQIGGRVSFHKEIETEAKVNLNEELFCWAIENLLKNAFDATDQGYVSIRTQKVTGMVIIDVEDTGKGIERKFHKEVFSPGYSTKKRGWGLGLSLTKRIIEEYHQGKIYVLKSNLGSGTTFRIEIPTKTDDINILASE